MFDIVGRGRVFLALAYTYCTVNLRPARIILATSQPLSSIHSQQNRPILDMSRNMITRPADEMHARTLALVLPTRQMLGPQ